MLPAPLKRLARTIPYTRRFLDSVADMRARIAALEGRVEDLGRDAGPSRIAEPGRAETARHGEPPRTHGRAPSPAVHWIDNAWCDMQGVYLEGWVHAGADPVERIVIASGKAETETDAFTPRPEIIPHYPHIPAEGAAGFSAYLACPAYAPLTLTVFTADASYTMPLRLPAPQEQPAGPDSNAVTQRFLDAMLERRGTVLELGARIVGTMTQGWRDRFEPACTYLGSDIHPGPGIDVVGDVHALTAQVAPGSLDGLFSVAVLEHLAAPWIAAMEINRSLKLGGETFHVTHQTWPVHETPNDFFRMSDQALRSLFGPAHGFEVIECGMAFPVAIVPPPEMRHSAWLRVPFGRGYGQSFIRARKVAEVQGAGAMGDATALKQVSEAYPRPATA